VSTIENAALLKRSGFDFIELTVSPNLLPFETDSAFDLSKRRIIECGLPVAAFNCFVPGDLKIVGPNVDDDKLEQYVATVLKRMAAVGAKIMVFGSGGARTIPEKFDPEEASTQIKNFLAVCNGYCEEFDLYIAIEPLNRNESNVINTLQEATEMQKEVNLPRIKLLVDSYHLDLEKEPVKSVRGAGKNLIHVHVAELAGRKCPGVGGHDFTPLFSQLKGIGYGGAVSIEALVDDIESEIPKGLVYLKEQYERA
jgi:sugar phosphate isomerase/epimerase